MFLSPRRRLCPLAHPEQVGWKGTAALMMKTQIGLGVLSIPAAFDTLGLIPGVLCLLAICFITLWSNHMVGVFKLNHPEVYGIEDVGKKIFGRIGSEVFGLTFALCGSLHTLYSGAVPNSC
jgi:amino acid permease